MMAPVKRTQTFKDCGLFGAIRRHDIHTGVDFYCEEGTPVSCIRDGVIIDIFQFTGEAVGSPWWNDTYAVVVESDDLVFVYGEVMSTLWIGWRLKTGETLGWIRPVLKVDKGVTPTSMLHLEVWEKAHYKKNCIWFLGHHKPEGLLDPLEVLCSG